MPLRWRDALPRDPGSHVQRRCQLGKRWKRIEKSLSSQTTAARMQKKRQKEALRHAAPDAQGARPSYAGSRAARSYHFCGCIPNDLTLTRSNGTMPS